LINLAARKKARCPREKHGKESDLLEYINHANALSAALNERTWLLHYEKQAARRLLSAFRFVSNCQLTRDATATLSDIFIRTSGLALQNTLLTGLTKWNFISACDAIHNKRMQMSCVRLYGMHAFGLLFIWFVNKINNMRAFL
jgi:hypothetical protein